MSLRQKLNNYIANHGQVSYQVLKQMLENGDFGRRYKLSNLERRLRPSESPEVEAVVENGAITAYRWKSTPVKFKEYWSEGRLIAKVPIY